MIGCFGEQDDGDDEEDYDQQYSSEDEITAPVIVDRSEVSPPLLIAPL